MGRARRENNAKSKTGLVIPLPGLPGGEDTYPDGSSFGQGDLLTSELIDPDAPAEDIVPWEDGVNPKDKQRITIMTDHKIVFPDLWLAVYIAGDKYEESAFANMLVRAACRKAKTPKEADLVIFTGGVDVDPQLYGAVPHSMTSSNSERDNRDMALYLDCLEGGIPMLGVCRGAQFLHVMNGGKLYQDVNGHNSEHTMVDTVTKELIERVSSVHHQMCMVNKNGMEILATGGESTYRHVDPKKVDRGRNADIEAFFYRDTCCLGVQGHPEYRGYNYYTAWCLKQIEQHVILNPDVEWEEVIGTDEHGEEEKLTLRRVNANIREQRKLLVMAAAEKACR